MDIDDIRKGRRRDWKPLMDPERKRRIDEQEAEGEAEEPAKPRPRSALAAREEARKEAMAADRAEFEKARRHSIIVASSIAALLLGWWLVSAISDYRASRALRSDIARLLDATGHSPTYFNLSTPIDAWASWRAAWVQQNAENLFRIKTGKQQSTMIRSIGRPRSVDQIQRLLKSGGYSTDVQLARDFSNPRPVYKPGKNPARGELAVFSSGPLHRLGDKRLTDWILAFVWEADAKEWRVAEVRRSDYWYTSWTRIELVQPLRVVNGGALTSGTPAEGN